MAKLRYDVTLPIKDAARCVEMGKELAVRVKEDWKGAELDSEMFTNGITNKIFSVFRTEDRKDRLMFRVFGENTERIIDRTHELEQWKRLSTFDLAAPLYGTFANGIICGFLPGNPLSVEQVQDPTISKKVAEATAFMHKIPVEQNSEPCTWKKLETFLGNVDPVYKDPENQRRFDEVFGPIDLRQLSTELQQKIEALNPAIAFCHNDLLIHNILFDDDTGKIGFIDYEYADANYELFDVGNHFNEWAGVDNVNFSRCPGPVERRAWLKNYYAARTGGAVDEEKLEKTVQQIPLFQATSHLFWVVWALVQSQNSTIDFDYLGYGIVRFREYERKLAEYEHNHA